MKNRPVQGITHITGLVYEDGVYVDGKLYSIQDGNTYSLKGKLKTADELETRGYKGVPMLGKTFKWQASYVIASKLAVYESRFTKIS